VNRVIGLIDSRVGVDLISMDSGRHLRLSYTYHVSISSRMSTTMIFGTRLSRFTMQAFTHVLYVPGRALVLRIGDGYRYFCYQTQLNPDWTNTVRSRLVKKPTPELTCPTNGSSLSPGKGE